MYCLRAEPPYSAACLERPRFNCHTLPPGVRRCPRYLQGSAPRGCIHPPSQAAPQKLPSKRTIPLFCTSLLRLVLEPVLEHPTIRTAAKINEAERNNFIFDHLLPKPSGYISTLRSKHDDGNAESRFVTKNLSHSLMHFDTPLLYSTNIR